VKKRPSLKKNTGNQQNPRFKELTNKKNKKKKKAKKGGVGTYLQMEKKNLKKKRQTQNQ